VQGRERSALPALNWEGKTQVSPRGPVARDALYLGIRKGSRRYFNGGETGRPADRSRSKPREGHPMEGDKRLVALCPPVPGKLIPEGKVIFKRL
jgi:hypothetical protein